MQLLSVSPVSVDLLRSHLMPARPPVSARTHQHTAGLAPCLALLLALGCTKKDGGGVTAPVAVVGISIAPLTVALAQGASTTVAIAIARTNFADAIALSANGVPTGVTVTFSSASTTGNSVTATIAVGNTAARGSYSIVITATGTGVASATAQLSLAVSGTPVTVTFCTGIPVWLAVQEGTTGNWRAITETSSGVFNFDLAAPIGGIAMVQQGSSTPDSYSMFVLFASLDQLVEFGSTQCDAAVTKAVTATVVKAAADRINVEFGRSYFPGSSSRTSYPFTSVPNGPVDLVAARVNGTAAANRVVIRRGLDVPTGTTLPAIDFTTTTEGFVPDTRTATTNGLQAGDFLSVTGSYVPNVLTGLAMPVGSSTTVTPSTFTFPVLPAAQIVTGDFHQVSADASLADGSAGYSAAVLMHTPLNTSLNLPAPPAAAAVTIAATTPYVRPRLTIARQTDYGTDLFLFLSQFTAGVFSRSMSIEFTGAYFGTTATDFTLPDFTGVGAFSGTWSLKAGVAASWQLILQGRTLAASAYARKNYYVDGQQFKFGTRSGAVTP